MSTLAPRLRPTTEDDITAEVIRRFEGTSDPRLRQVMQSLVRHLHGFLKEVQLTEAEWWKAIDFLTRTGQKCDGKRQEFILLSDILGVSALVNALHDKVAAELGTQSSLLGPFFREAAPDAVDLRVALA